MKRLTAIFLSLLMVVSLAACGSTTSTDGESASQPPASSQSADGSETVADQDVPEGFVLIEGGSFQMGSPDSEPWRSEDENQHSVTVSDFYISPYELTQADFQMVTDGNPSSFSGENLPVENISWLDAISYCNARSELEGLTPAYTVDGQNVTWNREANGYRLPTEAEWEYACRAGTTTPFNTENSPSADEVNYYGHYPYEIEGNYFSQSDLDTQPGQYRETTVEVGSFAPNAYGLYVKDPQDKKKWIVDEEAAKVVRRIFDLCIAGKGPMQIAKILTAEKVLTVTAYHAKQKGWTMPDNLYGWNKKSIAGILERREYTGCTVNFKTYTKSLKFKKRLENPKENQRIFEGTQSAIIEYGQWERVQALRENKRRPTKTGKTSIFSGLVRCADCGAKLYYCTCNSYKDDSQDHFVCSNYKSNTGSCQIHYIREITLYKRVLECVQRTLTYVRLFQDDFIQEMLMQDETSRKAELAQKRKALSGAQKRMEDLDKIIQHLYEDNVLGKLSDLRFRKLSAQYETEQAEIRQLSETLEREIAEEAEQVSDVGRFLQLAERYSNIQEPDAATVNELIEKNLHP